MSVDSALARDDTQSEVDEEPSYVNYRPPVVRQLSDSTSTHGKKKPLPGPKPSAVTTAIARFHLQSPQQRPLVNNAVGPRGLGNPPPTPSKPTYTASLNRIRPPMFSSLPGVSVNSKLHTTKPEALPKAGSVNKTTVVRPKQRLLLNNNIYAEAAEVQQHLLPPSERADQVEQVPYPSSNFAEDPIYEEAVPVKHSAHSNGRRGETKSIVPAHTFPLDENLYEEAASVNMNRLPAVEKRSHTDNVFIDPEPLYAEAADVIPSRLPKGESTTKWQKSNSHDEQSNTYEEAALFRKQSDESDNSDNDDEPLCFKVMFIQSNERSRNMLSLKSESDSTLAKAAFESKVHRMSMMLSRSDLRREKLSLTDSATLSLKSSYGLTGWPQTSSRCLSRGESRLDTIRTSSSGGASMEMRKFLISNMLTAEKDHFAVLKTMTEYMNTLKNAALSSQQQFTISVLDIDTIFFKIPDLHQVYFKLVHGLELALKNWTPEQAVAPLLKEFAFEEYGIGSEYLKNYHKAISTVQRCSSENTQFSDLTSAMKYKENTQKSLKDLLLMPILQFQRNALLLHDLIHVTPVTHADYDLLQKTLKLAQHFLNDVSGNENKDVLQDERYVVKHGVLVEQTKQCRKLRAIILFNDLIVCAKQKVIRQSIQFEAKWFIGLPDLSIDEKFSVQEEKNAAKRHQKEIEDLKKKLVESQLELRADFEKGRSRSQRNQYVVNQTKSGAKMRKKIVDLESQLLLASPYLEFKLSNWKAKKDYTLLMESDYERNNWKDIIKGLSSKAMSPVKLTISEVQALLNQQKMTTDSLSDDSDLHLEERMTGNLNVTIHKLQGLTESSSTFCSIEIDSFGHFFEKAKTRILNDTEPQWEEDFDIDLEGSQTLRIMCYKLGAHTDLLIGKSALELNQVWLVEEMKEEEITLKEGLVVTISLHYTSAEDMMRRTFREALFGGRLENIVKKEGSSVPLLVTSCVEELERRGLQTVGLYRVCGRADAVDSLKKDFNRNSASAAKKLHEIDVSVLASLLKLYFRELPEALFTDELYPEFVKGMDLSDSDVKETFMANQIGLLPKANHATAIYILDHLLRVAKHDQSHKMTLGNLAVVFGPTLLRPAAAKVVRRTPMEQLILQNSDAMMQTAILLYLLNLKERNHNFSLNSAA